MILRVALAQINITVGDLVGNRDKILTWMDRVREMKADIVAFPEMAITGYPPEDLLLKPDFVETAVRTLHEIVPASDRLTAIVSCVQADDFYNAAALPYVEQRGFDDETVLRVIRMMHRDEFKRRQSPPGGKITPRAFGKDWRLPIINGYQG